MITFFISLSYADRKVFENQGVIDIYDFGEAMSDMISIAAEDINHNDKIELLVLADGQIYLFEQTYVGSMDFELITSNFINANNYESISLVDIQNDNRYEIILGKDHQIVTYSQQDSNSYNFIYEGSSYLEVNDDPAYTFSPYLDFADLDDDEFNEAYVGVGHNNGLSTPGEYTIGEIARYEYNGNDILFEEFTYFTICYASIQFTDYNHNNKLDMVVSSYFDLLFFEQIEQNNSDFNFEPQAFDGITGLNCPQAILCDLDNDSVDDMLLAQGYPVSFSVYHRKLWAEFSVQHISGNTFQFVNESIGEIENYYWNFDWNDGSNYTIESYEENPTWTYDEPGDYKAILYIVNGDYNDYVEVDVHATTSEEEDTITNQAIEIKAFPNPFKPSGVSRSPATTIEFSISEDNEVFLSIYNSRGQHVKTITKTYLNIGDHQFSWDGCDDAGNEVSSGVYNIILKQKNGYKLNKRILLLK